MMKLLAGGRFRCRNLDILLVEQELVGDDRSALQSVVAADVELQDCAKKRLNSRI